MSSQDAYVIYVDAEPQEAEEAYKAVLKGVGASKVRDAVDTRIVNEVKKGKAAFKG